MQPRSVSASALTTWEECPAKYKAAYIDRVPEVGKKSAADTGTVCHYALQHFVGQVCLLKARDWSDKAYLDELVKQGYRETFNSAQYNTPEFKDAQVMVDNWYARTDLSNSTVLSVEQRVQTILPATSGDVPLTYIMDRVDLVQFPDGTVEIHVVDYKSQRIAESFDDLENKLQAQIYALAVFLQYSKQYRIRSVWVHLDLLRHSVVGVEFTREQAEETWYWLLEQVDLIRAMPDDEAPEVLGPGCAFCPRKGGCESLKRHVNAGGMMDCTDLELIAKQRVEAWGQLAGLKNYVAELDALAGRIMNEQQITRVQVGDMIAEWGPGRGMRQIDASRAAKVLGPELMANVASLNIGEVDKLFESGVLTEEQENELRSLITMKYPQAGIKYKKAPKPRKASHRP